MTSPNHSPIPVMGNRYKTICTHAKDKASFKYGAFDLFSGRTASITAVSKLQSTFPEFHYPLAKVRSDANFSLKILHPDILHVYDHFEDDDFVYLVSEFSDIPPISEMGPGSPRPDPLCFFSTMRKVVYAVEYYHSNQCIGCFIRPQHVLLCASGDMYINHLLDCRLSYLGDIKKEAARKILSSPEDAIVLDIACAGKVLAKLIEEMSRERLGKSHENDAVLGAIPALTDIAGRMCNGEFANIELASKALHDVDRKISRETRRSTRSFPPSSQRRNLAAGEILFREGAAPNGEAFIVERGMIQISKNGGNGRDNFLDVSKPGDIVGEMALIDKQPRMATARALEPSTLVVVTGKEFDATMEKMNSVGRLLVNVLVNRLRLQAKEVARLKALIGVER
ncbi:MAG: cyclic nucleotide-binding domain-containing protein [Alphaproteobacteria bacterium]|nr:cyclic nucleotide-binding domain-containing protein [Alphaproteobacteria bacterium]